MTTPETKIELRFPAARIKRLARILWVAMGGAAVVVSVLVWDASRDFPATAGWLALGTSALFVATFAWSGRRLLSRFEDVQVELDGDTLIGTRTLRPTVIRRDEVTRIVERPNGLEIHANSPPRSIGVVKDLDGYEALRAAVTAWRPIEPSPPFVERLVRDPAWLIAAVWVALRFGVPRLGQPDLSLIALVAIVAVLAVTITWYQKTGDQTEQGQLMKWAAIAMLVDAGFALWDLLGTHA